MGQLMSDGHDTEVEQTTVLNEEVYVCPGCGDPPPPEAVGAGVHAPCQNDGCLVDSFRWWKN